MDPALGVVVAVIGVVALVVVGRGWLRSRRETNVERHRAERAEDLLARERRDAQEERRVRELVLATMRDGILLIGPHREIVFANEAIERHLGSRPTSLETLLPVALRTEIVAAGGDGTRSVVVETGAPSRWLRCVITPAVDDHVLVVVRDVTEQRRLEAVRRDFVENASHELKTPAATIQATAETMRQAAADDPGAIPRFAAQLEREAIRLSRLVADLLDLSRLEAGSSLDERVSLAALLREEGPRFEEAAERAGVTLELRVFTERTVPGSSKDLSLLVRNLVDNAIRYSREGGKVIVEIEDDAKGVVVRVRDTGIGIPSKELSRIFERFYRVDRARSRETGGTGLGLAIVKHVVDNHGGTTSVESELERGSTFEVTLPGGSERPAVVNPER